MEESIACPLVSANLYGLSEGGVGIIEILLMEEGPSTTTIVIISPIKGMVLKMVGNFLVYDVVATC